MELRTLKYFIVVAEELNITRAAERLNMSQPPLTYQIKNLEAELNTTLFIRGKRHLQLTESGKLLHRRAKEILNLTIKASDEIKSMADGMIGTVSLGLVEGMAPDIAAEWFVKFNKMYPKAKFKIDDGNSDDLIEKLRIGLISLAVITAPYDQQLLSGIYIGKEKLVALMNNNHHLANNGKDSISISDLANENLIIPSRKYIVDTIYKWFKKAKLEPNIICEMNNYLDAAALAGRNLGISIFPQTAYIPNETLVSKPIDGNDKTIEYHFVWLKGRPLPLIEEAFIDFIKEFVNNKE